MLSFALITEGITDQAVISSILTGFYSEEPEIQEVQPVRDETDNYRQGNQAGWEKVLEYCSLEHFEQAFLTNDFVIIQIDTDVAEHPNFNIPFFIGGREKGVSELTNDIAFLISQKIGKELFEIYKTRIIFAICVHSIECWLLPLFVNDKRSANRTKNCEQHLSAALERNNISYKKDYRFYEMVSKGFQKQKIQETAKNKNESLKIFIDSLPKEQL